MAKYESKVSKGKRVKIKSLGIELIGGHFYQQKVLKAVYDAGHTSIVDKVAPKKKEVKQEDVKD